MSPILEFDDVVKSFGSGLTEVRALRGVTLNVEEAEFVAVMGPSGCGKSTLLHLAGALESPSAGSVRVGGRELAGMDAAERSELRRNDVGYVFQRLNLIPSLTAIENVMLPLELAGTNAAEPAARAMLARVGLGDRLGHYPKQLSGGEQQRVAIARAFVSRPKLLLADEPTGNLDERATRGVFQLLRDINASGTAVVMATHDLDLVRQAPYRVIELQEGALVYDSAVDEARDQAAAP